MDNALAFALVFAGCCAVLSPAAALFALLTPTVRRFHRT